MIEINIPLGSMQIKKLNYLKDKGGEIGSSEVNIRVLMPDGHTANIDTWGSVTWNTRSDDWVSVVDAMPEKEGNYICHFTDGTIEAFPYEYGGAFEWGVHQDLVTHWQHLPSPPSDK